MKYRARKEVFALKPYVPGKPISEVKRELGIDEVIKLASNENPLGPSPLAKEAYVKCADELMLYPDGNCYELKDEISRRFGIGMDQILIGNGSDEILKLLAETFLSPGDNVVMADPTFSEYDFAATIMGAEKRMVPLKGFRHDLPAMLEKIDDRTKMVFICNPNNPTGTIVYRDEVEDFMNEVPEDVLIVFDEAYHEYVEDDRYQSGFEYLLAGRPNVIVLRTFSKIYGLAGLRVGYALTTPEIIGLVSRVREPFNVNLPAQVAAVAALRDVDHVINSRKVNHDGKEYLYEKLAELGIKAVPTEANFILADVGRECRQVFQNLLREGVIVRTGDIFGHDFNTFIRITVGTRKQNERLITALAKVLEG